MPEWFAALFEIVTYCLGVWLAIRTVEAVDDWAYRRKRIAKSEDVTAAMRTVRNEFENDDLRAAHIAAQKELREIVTADACEDALKVEFEKLEAQVFARKRDRISNE